LTPERKRENVFVIPPSQESCSPEGGMSIEFTVGLQMLGGEGGSRERAVEMQVRLNLQHIHGARCVLGMEFIEVRHFGVAKMVQY
jgi:hypothetical protein